MKGCVGNRAKVSGYAASQVCGCEGVWGGKGRGGHLAVLATRTLLTSLCADFLLSLQAALFVTCTFITHIILH